MSLTITLTCVRAAPEEDVGQGLVRLYNCYVSPYRKPKGDKFCRGDYVAITNRHTGDKIVRVVVGSGHTDGRKHELLLDYESRARLALGKKEAARNASIRVRKATRVEVFSRYWNHEIRAERFAMRRDTISVALGVLGAGLGAISLYIAVA